MACAGAFHLWEQAAAPRVPYPPGTVDERFAALKGALPKDSGTVGYVGDMNIDANPSAYYLTQYALAPLVVVNGAHHRFVVGNFVRPEVAPRIAAANGLTAVRDFGNGIFLFRGEK